MNADFVVKIVREALFNTLIITSPILGASLLIGLVISIFQTTTSIQEQTLTFVPKFIGIFMAIIIFVPFIIQILTNFTNNLFLILPDMVK
ncbi:MAG: flagellar biosynthesis protein FliQ [Spirochaetes bacterium]|nr:flagellar biosynthesis protein FliQ [Spirochaetota bacterium]